MAKSGTTGSALVRAALAGVASVALCGTGAWAKVGVTSATDGDPLGKPPQANERVLKIGIDIQADEVVTTNANDRAHLLFLDGTSLTVGPNARVVVDKFVYDPNTKTGELAVTASKGVFRLVGGKISKTNAITVNTPSSTIGIRGGISIFSAGPQTIANFIFGNSMTVTAGGSTQVATRPGSQVIVNMGTPPSLPSLIPPGGLQAALSQLETGKSDPSGTGQGTGGVSGANSGQGFYVPPTPPIPGVVQQQVNNAVSGANNQQLPPTENSQPVKTTETLKGYVGGLIINQNGEQSTTRLPSALLAQPGDLTLEKNANTSQVTGQIIVRTLDVIIPVKTTVQMGPGEFISDAMYGMSNTPDGTSKVEVFGHTYNVQNTTQLVSNAFNAASSNPVVVRGTPGACTCEFLTWGWWKTSIEYQHGYRAGQTDKIGDAIYAPYVAGTLASSVRMPQTGTATYKGFMVGNVQNGQERYNAAGSYSSTVSFASRIGSWNASFDNRSYVGAIVPTPGSSGVSFSGAMVGTGGITGTMAGSYYSGGNDPAKYQAGTFAIGQNSSTYKASGVFAGQR